MTLVTVDASAAAAWLLPDEASAAADRLYERAIEGGISFQAPALWAWEAGNLLRMAQRRGRLTTAQMRRALVSLDKALIRLEAAPDSTRMTDILVLAERHGLTFYDGSYLEQAMRSDAHLASKDLALRRAAVAEGLICLEL